MRSACSLIVSMLLVAAISSLAQETPTGKLTPQEFYKQGHSQHGDAFDVGPREKPWTMEGIGRTHFPITTSNPEVQKWFDQGHTLLHSFWYYEAERSFRWCLRLDPDCAMAYWGLARASGDRERAAAFIQQAAKRKHKVSERERLYIEAWEELYAEQPKEPSDGAPTSSERRREKFKYKLDRLILKYPDDVEAKALYALENLWDSSRFGNELILRAVLARDPEHPGAHHYRIHNWDRSAAEQALESSRRYGQIVPGVGHAQHMPGHIFSGVGMWHEGAISMDSATRVEANYMRRRMTFPFNTWNYTHNRNYLGYIQEQLGMPEAALRGAKALLAAPHDPKSNDPDKWGTHWQGMISLMRTLVKFERWKDILDGKTIPWRDNVRDKMYKAYCETLAHLGLGNLEKAVKTFNTHADLKKEIQKGENKWLEETYSLQALEMQGMLHLAKGDALTGLGVLANAARRETEMREQQNDPPFYPSVIYNRLGYAYLAQKSPALAVSAFDKTLEVVRNDAFALSGLVQAYAAMGEESKARDAYARLLYVWSDAEPGLKWMEQAKAIGLKAEPRDSSPAPQRNYKRTSLDHLGPQMWESYEAPQLDAPDPKGKRVTLEEYRGKNVLLIFYLGEECPHCLDQLVQIGKKKSEFAQLNTEILAISSNTPEANAASQKLGDVPFRLLSDLKFENARRFKSYDDFEDLALHSTVLIDSRGRVHWARNGGDPFTNFDFLLKEIRRLNQINMLGGAVSQPIKSASAR